MFDVLIDINVRVFMHCVVPIAPTNCAYFGSISIGVNYLMIL